MIGIHERAPDGEVWLGPNQPIRLSEIWQDGELTLLLFYLFDWSST